MKLCILTLLYLFHYTNAVSFNTLSSFLEDFLLKLNGPSGILKAHLCWNQDKLIELQSILAKSNFLIRYKLIRNSSKILHNDDFYNHQIFLTDMECGFFDSLIQEAYEKELYKFPNKWIIIGNMTALKRKNHYFPVNSYTMVVEIVELINTIEVKSIYKIKNHFDYSEDTIAVWSEPGGFLFFNELTLVKNRTNFFRMPLRVSYVVTDNSTFDGIEDNRNKHMDKLTKINYLMFEKLVDIWNMTHAVILTDNWGFEFHPKKLYHKGMLGDLCYGRADVGGTVQYTPTERIRYFKYLLNTIKGLSVRFLFRAPPLPYSANLFALPFDTNVWIGCLVILILCCTAIWIIMRWEHKEETFEQDRLENEENVPNFLDIVMMQIQIVCQMDYYYEPRSTAGKIATITLLLGFTCIYNAFSARIVIILQSTANNLNDVRELYNAKMDMGVEDTGYNRYFFSGPNKRTNEELRLMIYENKIAPKDRKTTNFLSAYEGMKLVKDSYFAFQIETTTAANVIEAIFTNEEKCSLRAVDTIFIEDVPHIACTKNSTLIEYLLIGFHKLFETGVHSRENRRRYSKLPKCTGTSSNFVSVGLTESYFAFGIFIVAVLLSLFIFVLELIADVYVRHRKKGNNWIHVREFI